MRRFLSSLVLAVVLAGTLSWVFDTHALAGLIAAEGAPAADAVPLSNGDEDHSVPASQNCNHGCHLVSHFVGQVSAELVLPVLVTRNLLVPLSDACSSCFLESLDRPPLAPSCI